MIKEHNLQADVLVVGGGSAALFAAIKAKEAGAKVLLVDKGGAGYSGQSPYADSLLAWFDQSTVAEAVEESIHRGEYLTNKDYATQAYEQSEVRIAEMKAWGVQFHHNEDGTHYRIGDPETGCYNLQGLKMPATLRKHALSIGVEVVDRVMVADLLTKDGVVVGAVGISTDEGDFYIFHAKATILCTGASGLKSNGWPSQNLTGDGTAMAYRAGATIMGLEFADPHSENGEFAHYNGNGRDYTQRKMPHPAATKEGDTKAVGGAYDAEGNLVTNIGTLTFHSLYAFHEGRGPVKAPPRRDPNGEHEAEVGGISAGMSAHKTEGIVPKGILGDTEIPGLFAAGDAMATMQCGAVYWPGGALSGSCTTGAVAGTRGAMYAMELRNTDLTPDVGCVEGLKEKLYTPLTRKGGYSPKWVIEQLRNMMFPYFITYIKKADRMEAILTMLTFYRDHMAPMLKANDTHELRLANEVRNMILMSELKLRMALARKESRGLHYREDYPFRDDENFLCWLTLKQGADGTSELGKIDIPKEWLPEDFESMSYMEKYPIRMMAEKLPD